MKTRKKLFIQGGPFLIAIIIVTLIFVHPIGKTSFSEEEKEHIATSGYINVLLGNYAKNSTMKDEKYVPFFGSSELRRFDEFHPSVLAEKYNRSYRPFLFGTPGTQSLIHYGLLVSMEDELRGRKAVFIISPQWFISEGLPEDYFKLYFSPVQMYGHLLAMDSIGDGDRYYAARLLEFDFIQQQPILCKVLRKVQEGEAPTGFLRLFCKIQYATLTQEDRIFGRIGLPKRDLERFTQNLPNEYSLVELDKMATEIGKKNSTNNDFQIKNSFYSKRLSRNLKRLRKAQKSYDYTKSPEFADLELVLSKMAELDMDVLFILPPVSGRWSDYTWLSQDMLQKWSTKIRMQLVDQGFTNILDLTPKYREDYFMQDPTHLGWRGWVAIDGVVKPFLESDTDDTKITPYYQIKKKYFTKKWGVNE